MSFRRPLPVVRWVFKIDTKHWAIPSYWDTVITAWQVGGNRLGQKGGTGLRSETDYHLSGQGGGGGVGRIEAFRISITFSGFASL